MDSEPTLHECKTRWRSLRDLYHRKKKDQKLGKRIRSTWEYMEAMEFLENFTTEKKSVQDDQEATEPEAEDTKIDIKLEFDPEIPFASTSLQNADVSDETSQPKRLKLEDTTHSISDDNSSISQQLKEIRDIIKVRDEYPNYDNNHTILHLLREIREMVKAREDPIMAFFDSMAKTVMKFPPAQAAEVKLKVCQIVTEMECKILEESGNYPDNFENFDLESR